MASLSSERTMMIACYALYELRDLTGADAEPASFKRTHLELRRHLEEGDAGSLGEAGVGPRLRLVHPSVEVPSTEDEKVEEG